MPSHAPRFLAPVKQLETLAKRETALRKAVSKGFARSRIEEAAEGLRYAHLRVLKARRALIEYKLGSTEMERQVRKISTDESRWLAMSIDEIVATLGQDR